MKLLITLFMVLSMVPTCAPFDKVAWAGEPYLITQNKADFLPAHILTVTNPEGKSAHIDFTGDKVTYTGELPVDEAAKLFFDNVGALCKESKRQCTIEFIENPLEATIFPKSTRRAQGELKTKIITKWTTTSITTPVRTCPTCLIHYVDTCNQTGQKYEVTHAQIQWKGKQMEFELERNLIAHGPLYQSVTCEDSRWPMNSWFELK